MANKSGVVGWVGSKRINGRVFHSFKLDGEDDFYRTGFDPIPAEQGDFVSFEYSTHDKYGNQVDVSTVKKAEKPVAAAKGAAAAGGSYGDRQNSISYQSARNAALVAVNFAIDHDLLTVGGTKKADKFGLYLEQVKKVAEDFFYENNNNDYFEHIMSEKAEEEELMAGLDLGGNDAEHQDD